MVTQLPNYPIADYPITQLPNYPIHNVSVQVPLLTAYEKANIAERQPLPEKYVGLSDEEMDARIAAAGRRSADGSSFWATTISATR